MNKETEILKYSNPHKVLENAKDYLGDDVIIRLSSRADKKYMVYNPHTNKWIHFGQFNPPYEDFTKHNDENRRRNYLIRTSFMKGNWSNDKYSPNMLSRRLLWG